MFISCFIFVNVEYIPFLVFNTHIIHFVKVEYNPNHPHTD